MRESMDDKFRGYKRDRTKPPCDTEPESIADANENNEPFRRYKGGDPRASPTSQPDTRPTLPERSADRAIKLS
jgi:hypothetical protein